MKFIFRFIVVLAVAVGLGFALYYAVQALPDSAPRFNPSNIRVGPENGTRPENPEFRPERVEGDREGGGGIHLRSLVGVAGKAVLFAILVFAAIIGKNILFGKKPNGKKTDG